MSIAVMSRVWSDSQHAGSTLLMLLAIADFADDDGQAYPAVQKLADKCRMTKRNAQDRLRELADSGELSIFKNQGPPPKFPNLFQINLTALGVKPTSPVKPSVFRGEAQRIKGMKPTSPKPSVPIKEPSREAQDKPASRSAGNRLTFTKWAAAETAAGRTLIAGWQPLKQLMDDSGLDVSLVNLAWAKFKDRYTTDPNYQRKTYIDWRSAFLNSLRGNWFRLWFIDGEGQYQVSNIGAAAQREQDAIDKRTEETA